MSSKIETAASPHLPPRRRSRTVFMLCATLLLGACGTNTEQRDAVAEFSRGTSRFGAMASSEVVEARQTVVDLNTYVLALDPAKLQNREALEGSFTAQAVESRVRAADALRDYGELLLAIVRDDADSRVRAASQRFAGSIKRLDPATVKLSDAELTGIGKAVAAIGGMAIDEKRASALKEIVPKAHPQVEALGKLFASEFDPARGPIARRIDATAQLALQAADKTLDNRSASVADRHVAAEALRDSLAAARRNNAVMPALAKAADALVATHERLVKALAADSFTLADVKAFAEEMGSLRATAKTNANK